MDKPDSPSSELSALHARIAELEERLASSSPEANMRALFDDLFEGIQIIDPEYRYVYVNDTAAQHGRSVRGELIGRRMAEAFPGIEESDVFVQLRTCMKDRVPSQMVNRFQYADGRAAWFELRFRPVPIGVLILSVDVSAEKAAAEELRLSRDDLATTLECMADGVIATGVDGRVSRMNPAAELLTGWTEDEAKGRGIDELVRFLDERTMHPVDHVAERVLRDGLRIGLANHTMLERRDGERIPISSSGAPIRDASGAVRGVVMVLKDMKQEYALTGMLQRSQKMEALGTLAAGVAHDFNNLLTVISGYSEILLGKLALDDKVRGPIQMISKAGEQAAGLTRQLLAFSRQQVLEPVVLDLNGVVGEMHGMIERLLGEDVAIVVLCEPDLAGVLADPGKIEQVIVNLAVNARDAMPKGGSLTIQTANVELDAAYVHAHADVKPGSYVMLAVSDTGCGMDAATQARIFEPFFTTKEAGKGTGLGLATVFGIVRQSGGHIWLYSEPDQGTTFRIYLPVSDQKPPPRKTTIEEETLHGAETILVVEDDDTVRGITIDGLEEYGYRILEARGGLEAIEIAETQPGPIEVLMTDAVMPGLTGQAVAERLVALRPDIRVLVVSGYSEEVIARRGALGERIAFLQKPFTVATLARKIRQLLET